MTKKTRNLKSKLADKLPGKNKKQSQSLMVTNNNIEEYRKDILARGRKLKYPVQYSKKRLIIVSVIIVALAFAIFVVWLNRALYKEQQTGDFYYSVTKTVPLNVAKVDGYPVKYEDYLRRLRADIHYYVNREGRSFNSKEGKRELDFHKRQNLDTAEKVAYTRKLASEHNLKVTNGEVEAQVKKMRSSDQATDDDLTNTLKKFYGWTINDLKATTRDEMLERKVSYEIDTDAKDRIEDIQRQLKSTKSAKTGDAVKKFESIAKKSSDDASSKNNGGKVVAKDTDDDPTGILDQVKQLAVGQTSDIKQAKVNNENYYYIVRLDSKEDDKITYHVIMEKLTKLDDDFKKLQDSKKIEEYINVPKDNEF